LSFEIFYRRLRKKLRDLYPSTQELLESVDFEILISPNVIRLPKSVWLQAEAGIKAFYQVSRTEEYQNQISTDFPWLRNLKTDGASVLMAYDFHTTADGRAFLVEINTNGAGFLLADLTYQNHEILSPLFTQPLAQLKSSFSDEVHAWGVRPVQSAAIVDETPERQKMFIEFLMYKDVFQSWGWKTQILDSSDPQARTADLIYNRLTDFYFEAPKHNWLLHDYLNNRVCITPNPREYWLLADKERLSECARNNGWNHVAIQNILIPTYELDYFGDADGVWAERKNLFFKPRRSHGGKAVYRGASVSRKVFERILSEDYVAQQFVPAQSWSVGDMDSYMENWKFDLRFFVYRDQIQLAIARSYQGQVTNFSSQFGGWTAVEFTK